MKNKKIRLIVVLTIVLVIIDQLSKILITTFVNGQIGNEYIGFQIANNTGLAFGFNDGSNTKNIFLMIFVLFIVIRFIKNQIELIDTKTAVALSMVLSGGIGNLFDRIFRGAVVDFVKVFNFPLFNIADSFVVIGTILLIIFLVIFTRKIEV